MRVSLSILVLFAVALTAGRAHARLELVLCNAAPVHISSAVGYLDQKGMWRAEGWWNIAPGRCIVPDIATNNRYVYVHAESGFASLIWDGKTRFCTHASNRFHLRDQPSCDNADGFELRISSHRAPQSTPSHWQTGSNGKGGASTIASGKIPSE